MQSVDVGKEPVIVLFSVMSAFSDGQGLTGVPTGFPTFIQKIICALHHLEQSDDIIVTSHHLMSVFTTEHDDITQYYHGNSVTLCWVGS